MQGLSPPPPNANWRRSSRRGSSMHRKASSQGSVYSDDKPPRSRLSALIRKDSFDLPRPSRPPRPHDSIDLAVFAEAGAPSEPNAATNVFRELEQALGPLDPPTRASSFASKTQSPKRVPVPQIETSLHEFVLPPSASRQISAVSQVTTSSFSGRRAKRRDDLKRLASIIGEDVLKGVNIEEIVHMERKTPKSAEISPSHAHRSMLLDSATLIRSPKNAVSVDRFLDASKAGPSSLRSKASLRTAPSIRSSASQGPRKLQRSRSTPTVKTSNKNRGTGGVLAKFLTSRSATTPPASSPGSRPDIAIENLTYALQADVPTGMQAHIAPGRQGPASGAAVSMPSTSTVFGKPLGLLPDDSMCLALIGGEMHRLPIVVFAAVEQLFKRGLRTSGLFRLPGDQNRVEALMRIFDSAPLFGDHEELEDESVHNVAGLFKRYLRDMPTPVFDDRLMQLFSNACVESDAPVGLRVIAARIIIRLLPKRQLSLFVYLLAFLAQIPLHRGCHLDQNALGIVLGPAIMAPRSDSIVGLGSPTSRAANAGLAALDTEGAKAIRKAQTSLTWMLEHWSEIGTDFIASDSSAPQTDDPLVYSPIGVQGLGVTIQDAAPALSLEAAVITPSHILDSPIDPLDRPTRSRQLTADTETSASFGRSPAPSFGSRSRRSSSTSASARQDKGTKAIERSSSTAFGADTKMGSVPSSSHGGGGGQIRKIVALEAELAEARRASGTLMDLREQVAKREEEQDAKLVETRHQLEHARKEARRLKDLLERERIDKARRIEELEAALAFSTAEKEEIGSKLATVRSMLGFV